MAPSLRSCADRLDLPSSILLGEIMLFCYVYKSLACNYKKIILKYVDVCVLNLKLQYRKWISDNIFFRTKMESGVIPEQTRCCKLQQNTANPSLPLGGKTARRSKPENMPLYLLFGCPWFGCQKINFTNQVFRIKRTDLSRKLRCFLFAAFFRYFYDFRFCFFYSWTLLKSK